MAETSMLEAPQLYSSQKFDSTHQWFANFDYHSKYHSDLAN